MKTIGLIGGISWQSTSEYYRLINQITNRRLGGNSSAKILLCSVNFQEIESAQICGDWEALGNKMVDAGRKLERAGADCVMICANTMHKVAHVVEKEISLPLINIIAVTARQIVKQQINCVGLLGTRFTMGETFYTDALKQAGIDTIVPDQQSIKAIHRTIHEELIPGRIVAESKATFLEIIEDLVRQGAEGIILGCTEIPLLITPSDTNRILFDTTAIHAAAAADFALGDKPMVL